MKELTFKIICSAEITNEVADAFIELLVIQDKVKKPTREKIKSCRELVLCYADSKLIGIGALKEKTKSVFNDLASGLKTIEQKFTWELGYFYVDKLFRGYGISTTISRLLLNDKSNENILASTELNKDNAMIFVLKKFGFRQFGNPWPSSRHDGTLGLFLKFKSGE